MPRGSISGSLTGPRVDLFVDMGHPLLNRTVDGFLRVGTVGLAKAATEEAYHIADHGKASKSGLEHALKRMCKEGALWGSVAGVYAGMEYGVARIRGTYDWKNAMIGGALTGAAYSVVNNGNREKIVKDAITGGALATASVFLNHITY